MCGIFGSPGHPEASNLVYLGLYALQHRGQEAAGIVSTDGTQLYQVRKRGPVADAFDPTSVAFLKGPMAIGHVHTPRRAKISRRTSNRLSPAGSSGSIAVAHNGNLTNFHSLRKILEDRGAIFQSTMETADPAFYRDRKGSDDWGKNRKRTFRRGRSVFASVLDPTGTGGRSRSTRLSSFMAGMVKPSSSLRFGNVRSRLDRCDLGSRT